ncbi:hypothetical protein B0H14DRAFT_3474391 [Mycena olivaceomarginata]|nr:hypothetical protein B0H14DRAFT_3474391 [Mycena olivaceomarginata]
MTLLRVAARSLFTARPHRHAMRRVTFELVSRPSTLTGRIAAFHQSSIRQQTLEEHVKKIVAEQLENTHPTARKITNTKRFIDDLGADSLGVVELLMALEDTFEIDIPDEAMKITTVQANYTNPAFLISCERILDVRRAALLDEGALLWSCFSISFGVGQRYFLPSFPFYFLSFAFIFAFPLGKIFRRFSRAIFALLEPGAHDRSFLFVLF